MTSIEAELGCRMADVEFLQIVAVAGYIRTLFFNNFYKAKRYIDLIYPTKRF